jgi:MFS family permease
MPDALVECRTTQRVAIELRGGAWYNRRHPNNDENTVPSFTYMLLRLERFLFGGLPERVRRNTRFDLAGALAYGVFFSASLAFLPVVLRRLGASTTQLALYVTLTYVGQLLAPLSLSVLRRIPAMTFATTVWAIGRAVLVVGLFVNDANWLLVLAGIFWIAEALPGPAYSQIMQQSYPPAFRGRAMSGVRIGMTVTLLLLMPFAGQMLDRYGHQLLLGIAALFGVISTLLFAYMRPIIPSKLPTVGFSLPTLMRLLRGDGRFRLYLTALVVYGFGAVMPLALYPVIQVSRLQLSYSQVGYLALTQSLFWLIGYLFWGRLLDKRGAAWVLRIGILLAAIIPFTYIWAHDAWVLLPAFIAQGLLQGAFELGVTNISIELAEHDRVLEYTALQTAAIGLRGMVAPFLGAALLQVGLPEHLFLGLCVALILVAVVMMGNIRGNATNLAGSD